MPRARQPSCRPAGTVTNKPRRAEKKLRGPPRRAQDARRTDTRRAAAPEIILSYPAPMSSKFEREIAKFRQQQQEASKQLEKKEAPKKPKKEPTPAVVRAALPPPDASAARRLPAPPSPSSLPSFPSLPARLIFPRFFRRHLTHRPSPTAPPLPQPARHGPSVAYLLRQALKALQAAARPLTPEEARHRPTDTPKPAPCALFRALAPPPPRPEPAPPAAANHPLRSARLPLAIGRVVLPPTQPPGPCC